MHLISGSLLSGNPSELIAEDVCIACAGRVVGFGYRVEPFGQGHVELFLCAKIPGGVGGLRREVRKFLLGIEIHQYLLINCEELVLKTVVFSRLHCGDFEISSLSPMRSNIRDIEWFEAEP